LAQLTRLTRRKFIRAAAGLAVTANGLALPARGLTINPRSSWAVDRPPKGPLSGEDVRFLLVHHSASRNGHTSADAPAILRSFYDYHTSAEKGWDDIAYNFLIDADGGIWEGRAGSLAGPVAGDATGGNQGFSQLVCIIGDYNAVQPSAASLTSLVSVLAWLADRYGVSTAPGAEITFTSRGSNKHPAGTTVTSPTITGHREMSQTTCPGDNLNAYVVGALRAHVEAARGGSTAPPPPPPPATTTTTSTTTSTTTTTTVPPTTTVPSSTTLRPSTTLPQPSTTAGIAATTAPASPSTTIPVAVEAETAAPSGSPVGILATAGALVATGAGLLLWRYRRISGS
jgi:hypothetical protein